MYTQHKSPGRVHFSKIVKHGSFDVTATMVLEYSNVMLVVEFLSKHHPKKVMRLQLQRSLVATTS